MAQAAPPDPVARLRRFRSCCLIDLPPSLEHQDAPQQRRPIPLPALMLVPATRHKRAIQHVVLPLDQCFVGEFLQLSAEPLRHRHCEIPSSCASEPRRQYPLQRFFEDVFPLRRCAASDRRASARSTPSACDRAAGSALRANLPCWRDPLSSGCRRPDMSSCRRTGSAKAGRPYRRGRSDSAARRPSRSPFKSAARRRSAAWRFMAGGQHDML